MRRIARAPFYPANVADSICVTTTDPYISSGVVSAATGMWGGCGAGIPSIVPNSSGCTFQFDVTHISGVSTNSSGSCGQFSPTFNNSVNPPTINGGTIIIWDATQYGNDCELYRSETIAHEIGF